MRRLARHVFTISAVLSLLLCVAASVLWVRSYRVLDGVKYAAPADPDDLDPRGSPWSHTVYTRRGSVHYMYHRPPGPLWDESSWTVLNQPQPAETMTDDPRWRAFGFGHGNATVFWVANVPFWFFVLLSVLPPALWMRLTYHRRKLARFGMCNICGYDLRATPDRCPECGATPDPSEAVLA